jgi:beta-phosphoglucomutase family hydrolase
MNVNVSRAFEAVVFDLDGVITKTAVTHAAAWKKMFDEYLKKREKKHNEPFSEFTQSDYLAFVDGKPRYNGVASFLESREINLPWGAPEDNIDAETVCGLGNRKNEAFHEVLKRDGAEVYPSSEKLLFELKEAGVKLGVASSSKNCKAVLETVNLLHLFEARVDGVVSAELGLKGKPEPDIFTKACEILKAKSEYSIVVEDAVSGVQAGAKGKFGLTLGVAREGNAKELKKNGADYVVNDLEDVNGSKGLNELFLRFHKRKK